MTVKFVSWAALICLLVTVSPENANALAPGSGFQKPQREKEETITPPRNNPGESFAKNSADELGKLVNGIRHYELFGNNRDYQPYLGREADGRKKFYIQNNRKSDRKDNCSSNCRFCYRPDTEYMNKRLAVTQPFPLNEMPALMGKLSSLGYERIHLVGEETLDDIDSFWCIVDSLSRLEDSSISRFVFFTNGFYFLEKQDPAMAAREFFTKLKSKLGNIQVEAVFSWDEERVRTFLIRNKAATREGLLKAMREVVQAYEDTNNNEPIVRSVGTRQDRIESRRDFEDHIGKSSLQQADIEVLNERAVRMLQASGVEVMKKTAAQLYEYLESESGSTVTYKYPYWATLDMATSDLAISPSRRIYPAQHVSAVKLEDALFGYFHNPRLRRMFMTLDTNLKFAAMTMGFAIALKPELAETKVPFLKYGSFDYFESIIGKDHLLMRKIEMMFLLWDLILSKDQFKVKNIPKGLKKYLLSDEILIAQIKYFQNRAEASGRQIHLSIIPKKIGEIFHSEQAPTPETLAKLRVRLEEEILQPQIFQEENAPIPVIDPRELEEITCAL